MKLCILSTFVTLLGLVSLTSARFVPFRSHSVRYGGGALPVRAFDGESSYGWLGETNYNNALGGSIYDLPLRPITRSFKPQYGTFTDGGAEGSEHQIDSDAVPWATY